MISSPVGDLDKNGIIKRLNHLKKIADHESHGNIHKAEEFSFISVFANSADSKAKKDARIAAIT